MCGRFVHPDQAAIERAWSIRPRDRIPQLARGARYNVCPGTEIPVIRAEGGDWALGALRWGLVPAWAGEAENGLNLINARSETVAEKPAFRDSLRKRRCLVPATGWFEWQVTGARRKQPWYLHAADDAPLLFAAIWARKPLDALRALDTVCLLTRPASAAVDHIHNRMPVVFPVAQARQWLQAGDDDVAGLSRLALEQGRDDFAAHRVSERVSRPVNDDAQLIDPVSAPADPQRDLWDN